MIQARTFEDETVAVMGLARSGLASVRALVAGGARVLAWDDNVQRCDAAASLGAEITDLAQFDFSRVGNLVLSPGIPHTHPVPHPVAERARAHGAAIIGDIELLIRACPQARVVGITGTNGKSTTTALVGHILAIVGMAAEVGGNIGRPALEFEPMGAGGIYVLELSSYQLELTPSLACDVAVLLNISPDHLDRHGGLPGYIAAKEQIFAVMARDGTAVLGIDDQTTRDLGDGLPGREGGAVVRVSGMQLPSGGVGIEDGQVIADLDAKRQVIADLTLARALPGSHNAQNAAAAAAVALSLGVAPEVIGSAILSFPGLPHRQERVGECGGVSYVNDSKATNADAAARALACYAPIYWIVGGIAKEGGIDSLAPYFSRIARAFLIGESSEQFAATLEGRVTYTVCNTLGSALAAASVLAHAQAGDGATVLLSPAAASFDQFASYEVRGDCFRGLVSDLLAEKKLQLQGHTNSNGRKAS
jgi:UDP-N-acetylmuramoylalanine--D-glutamate ligase